MKRQGNLFEQICSMDNLRKAHENAKKGKGWYEEVKQIDADPDKYLNELQAMLRSHTYHTSKYTSFTLKEGKKERKIYKLPYFPDRICQWAIMQVIEPFLLRHMTADTYSAIPNRGIHKCLNNVKRAVHNDVMGCRYCLKLDVHHYYPSLNHEVLKMKFRRLFKDSELLWLLDEITDSISTADIDDLRNVWLMDEDIDEETGVPIGNYFSQYCGNFYLTSFDHWLKEEKRVKHYFRYMDDIVIFGKTKEELHRLRIEIDRYFVNNLLLHMKSNWQIFPSYVRGVDFVGYRVFLNYTLLRKSTCLNMEKKMLAIHDKTHKDNNLMNYSDYCSINSYDGWLKSCDSHRLKEKYLSPVRGDTDRYYNEVIKPKTKKGKVKKNEKLRNNSGGKPTGTAGD